MRTGQPKRLKWCSRVLATAFVLSGMSELANASIIYSDSTFNNSDWTLQLVMTPNGGAATASQVATGGNPGTFRKIDISVTDGSVLYTFHGKNDAVYNPATQGAIASINYSEEGIILSGGTQSSYPALMQDGKLYIYPLGYNPTNNWTPYSVSNVIGVNFGGVFFTGAPDFTANGSPITFGFARGNSTGGAGGFSTSDGIDNWSLTVNPVPEPATLAILAMGTATILIRRRRVSAF